MARALVDSSGTPVTVEIEIGAPVSAYVVRISDGVAVGRAEFIDSPDGDVAERIFFHTEVDPAFGGRGLAGVLMQVALEDSIREGRGIVPVCPLFARHLSRHGTEFVATGGRFRSPERADVFAVGRAVRERG